MQITDGMVEAAIRAMEDSQGFIAPATPRYMRMALEAALSHAAGQEAVAWRTIKPCGLRRHMTQAQYDANPNVQKWYEPFKCADCRSPAQPPASAGAERDAARYNKLKELFSASFHRATCDYWVISGECKTDPRFFGEDCEQMTLDAAIDAAMAASSGRKD